MRLSCSRLFPDDTSRKRIVGRIKQALYWFIYYLLDHLAARTDNEFSFCFAETKDSFESYRNLAWKARWKQDNSISHGSIRKKAPLSKQRLKTKHRASERTKLIWIKNIFLMQTLNDLLTEALTYNWACIIQTTFNMGEMENKISISICVLKHSSVHEWLKTCSMKTQSGERKKAKKIKLHLDICCQSAPSWEENWTENGIQTNRTMGISADNRRSSGRFHF